MKLVHYQLSNSQKRIGLVENQFIYDLKDLFTLWSKRYDKPLLPVFSFEDFFRTTSYSNFQTLQEVFEFKSDVQPFEWNEVKILPPISTTSKILAVGRNYATHARELGNVAPSEPFYFTKLISSVIAHLETIYLPPDSQRVDHEGELAVIIGKKLNRHSTQEEVMNAIYGYTIVNDVTARDLQKSFSEKGLPWTRAKNYDTFCPLGPVIITADAFQPNNKTIRVTVNEIEKQKGNTQNFIFDIPILLSFISKHITFEVGDVLLTGTPEGVSPLSDGDVVSVEIEGIGTLTNFVKAAQ
ncbi:MAG: fumarylacetoacetate hydrolase family protein [bacterium]|nr:fumarylacetoacetate hydrolase family protein [bacterium]